MIPPVSRQPIAQRGLRAGLVALLALAACSDNNNPAPPPIGVAPDPIVTEADRLPGVVVAITRVYGGSGPNGKFRVGDFLSVDFTVARDTGAALELANMTRGAIMVSGPTSNYQRVIASQGDVITASRKTALGAYTYKFTQPVPATYLAPLNDTTALTDGEWTGRPLIAGTYTVGIELRKDYVVGGATLRDPGNTTADFLLGDASTIERREVVTLANCNQCHGELRGHGDNRNNVTNCLLCHTGGAEDRNTATVANGTPGATIDFKVMIHKIHSGLHLPSVLGVTTNPDGSRKYDATPQPYQLIGFGDSVHDYSNIGFPAWPSFFTPMPRDLGYTALVDTSLPTTDPRRIEGVRRQGLENTMRSAPIACDKCHGDPDGSGPLPAPAQGELIYAQPTRLACASCHDDWVPELPYRANSSTMPAQRDDAACKDCHRPSGTPLDIRDAHTHPLVDGNIARGLNFNLTAVDEVAGDGDGRFEAGEKIGVTFHLTDDAGNAIAASGLSRIELALNGPTTNPNMVHLMRVAQAAFTGNGPYTFNVPANFYLESVGNSTGTTGSPNLQTYGTMNAPHWAVSGAATAVFLRTATGTGTTLAANAPALQNYIDVAAGTGANFTNGGYLVLEDLVAGRREFIRVQWIEGDRLWFSSQYRPDFPPRLTRPHAMGATVHPITVATVAAANYSLDRLAGNFTETTEFGTGEVLCSYTADFVIPSAFPGSLNESPELDDSWGDWTGLALPSGTYTFGLYGARSVNVVTPAPVGTATETTGYTEGGRAATRNLLFGNATSETAVHRIDGSQSCNACHVDIQFHGGSRRGYETCILCHGTAGAEDAAKYTYPTATTTESTTVDFRTMLHKIHHGKELAAGANYVVIGNGGTGHTYEMVGFPYMPGGTGDCASCHGKNNTAWAVPAERNHPAALHPTRAWRAACGSCHDSSAETAHIDANTSPAGAEACAICHGEGEDKDVRAVHIIR
ncbi:MAG: hypothetical protein IPK26_18065 [Planctomycetes bacterium]|nr:hypothetical protein [Planctomycetota bacterium]